jgi:Predicted AAA-ATPase
LPAFRDGSGNLPLYSTDNISTSTWYHDVCGLTENEVRTIAKAYLASTHDEAELEKELVTMKRWINGHRFYPSGYGTNVPSLYNPRRVFAHLRTVSGKAGHLHLDEELDTKHIASVLNAIKGGQHMNAHDLLQLLSGNLKGRITTWFGVSELKAMGKSAEITWSFLYYFGVVTRGQEKALITPNLTMRFLVRVFLALSFPLSI